MKYINYILFLLAMQSTTSCHKSSALVSSVSINFINAIPASNGIIPVLGTQAIQYYSTAREVYYQQGQLYSPISGVIPLTIIQISDTTVPIFKGSLTVRAGGIYSFYLAGDTIKPETMLLQDTIPVYYDSSAGVRFINLSPDSHPISVNIQGNLSSQTEFSSLGFNQISSFKKYLANSTIISGNYTFEIRDQASNTVLTTFIWGYTLFKNNTLVISGSVNPTSTTPITVFQVNNF